MMSDKETYWQTHVMKQENSVVLSEKINSLEKRVAQYQQAYESLMHQIQEANRNIV